MLKLCRNVRRSFGWLGDYKERVEMKLVGTHKVMPVHQFFTTTTRPSNFGDQLDLKIQVDNWFEENRIHNEENPDIRRTQLYLINAVAWGGILSIARLGVYAFIARLVGNKRYDRDSYLEMDISGIPPGEVVQVVWNGEIVFIRRLTRQECAEEEAAPEHSLLDPKTPVLLNEDLNSKVLVVSAKCTHLGCIPIPYLGNFKGWTCVCHGSVFDRFGRVRQGPALENLRILNNSLYGDILCIEELKYPREPSKMYYV